MSWLAEVFRKTRRICERCGIGPTHLYDPGATRMVIPGLGLSPEPGNTQEASSDEIEMSGQPLCGTCLTARLEEDLSAFPARALLFEPSLGPEELVFHPLAGEAARLWPAGQREAAAAHLAAISPSCDQCDGPGRFLWVPVAPDANLWGDDWIAGLMDGTLSPGGTLCGLCAARRLSRSIEERGLQFEAVVPPRGSDGVLFGTEGIGGL